MATPAPPDWLERARTMRQEGRLADAVESCRRALETTPGDARALSELAHALRWQGELHEAHSAATRAVAIAPELASAWFNLGAVQVALGELAPGIASYRAAIALQPDFAEAWSNLGDALRERGDHTGELEAYRRAIAANPRLAPVWSNLGNALREAGEIQEAVSACRRAVDLDPGFAPGWNNLAIALQVTGEHGKALEACAAAVRLAPGMAESWGTLGAVLHGLGRYEEALHAQRNAIARGAGDARLHFNLGVTLQHCGRGAEAIASFRRALEIQPGHAQAHWDLSFALLGSGQLPEGWDEYEWRWRRPNAEAKRYGFAAWNGDVSKPCRLLLWGEQGVGDQLLYSSVLPELVSSPLSITLEVDPRLVPLYRRSFPGVVVIEQEERPAADPFAYDAQMPLGTLGRWLRPAFESFPRHRGYLKPDPSRVEAYRRRLLERPGGAKQLVGISWKSANKEFGAHKSSALREWLPLLRVPGCRFVDLQYGPTANERADAEMAPVAPIEHLPELDLYGDLEGVAALCAACDLVITVSNVTAHVAGALGRPVWLLAPRANGRLWYWFSGRSDSPWYPSMRIFTQQAAGDWSELFEIVARELAALNA